MSIRTKILIPLLGFLLLGAAVSAFIGWQSLSGFSQLAALSDKAVIANDASRKARDGFDTAEALVARVLAMTDMVEASAIEPKFRSATTLASSALADLRQAALTDDMHGLTDNTIAQFGVWQKDAEVLLGITPAKEIATLEVMRTNSDRIRRSLDQAIERSGRDARTQIATGSAALAAELKIVFLIALTIAAAGAAGAFWLAGNLSQPLRALVRSAETLAGGDVSVAIGALDRKDEVGDIARAVDVFRANVTAQATSQAEAAEQRRLTTEERKVHDAAQAAASKEQDGVIEALAAALKRLAVGDLTSTLANIPPAYKLLETDFNTATAQLRKTVADVMRNTRIIHSRSQDMSASADDLSDKTEQQAASLKETATALNDITKQIREAALGAKRANDVVFNTKTEAERTGVVVHEAVAAMAELERSSGMIEQIIGVIDEIAFQTNLLALNAGVEAARAGETGRGFAVVASEVRALAQRSAGAAKEIKQLISKSARQIETGVVLVRQTGSALDRILIQVAEINTVVTAISASATEQAAGLDEVNRAVAIMDKTTQTNAALVGSSATVSGQLLSEADDLTALVAGFTVEIPNKPRAGRAGISDLRRAA